MIDQVPVVPAQHTHPGSPAASTQQYEAARTLRLQGQHSRAVQALRVLLRADPQHIDAWLDLGGLLMLLGQPELARRCFARLLRLQPRHSLALFNAALTHHEQGDAEAALQGYQAALVVDPLDTRVLFHLEFARLGVCDWQDHDERTATLARRLAGQTMRTDAQARAQALPPLYLLSFAMPLALHCALARQWASSIVQTSHLKPAKVPAAARPSQRPPRIRMGYLSADFRAHAVGGLVHGLFAHHDRTRFEVFAYALVEVADEFTASVQRGVEHFVQLTPATDALTIAQRIQADRIDVLIDLMGYTHLSRPDVLALRPAPLQLHYLGYPGTLQADFIDGVIADEALIPERLSHAYLGAVYRLPCAFVASAAPEGWPAHAKPQSSRASLGLPENGVVYLSVARPHKLDPHTFALWMRVLQAVPGSVLWLIQDAPGVRARLTAAAEKAGVPAHRLVFTSPVPLDEFAGLCALADLLLDTTHYGAGATAVTALGAGLPLLTCPGDTFASRMGASLCVATGLQELIASSPDAYQAQAIALGLAPLRLVQLRQHLLTRAGLLPLFQTAAWTRSLEDLLAPLVLKRSSPQPIRMSNPNPTTLDVSNPDAFAAWLKTHNIALAFSTYRANRLIFVGRSDAGKLKLHERLFDRPMGLYVDDTPEGRSLWMAGRSQVWRFDDLLEPGQHHEGGDRLYVPAACYTTGEVNAHEIVLVPDAHGANEPLFVNTAFSCLATLGRGSSFVPTWQPPFITQLSADDRCHLNGLALLNGVPTWATACGTLDAPAAWRDARSGGGVVLHIPTGVVVASGLTMPHSPRWHQGRLWLLNSGTGELGWIDDSKKDGQQFVPLCFMPGFARGLAFVTSDGEGGGERSFAVVGLSKLRSPQFTGLPLEKKLHSMQLPVGCCGLRVIDLATGQIIHSLDLPEPIDELFDVVVLPGAQQPRALGLQTEDIHCLVKLPGRKHLTTIRPKAPSGNPHQAKPPPVFGLPVAQGAVPDNVPPQVAAELPVRYQQVFQLTPQTLAPYAGMTFPSLAPGSPGLARVTGELLAVSAMCDGTMVGMAVAERHDDGSAGLVSLMVQPEMRLRGIATRMVAYLQKFLTQEGVRELRVRFHASAATTASFEPLLRRLAWSAPQTDFVLIQSSAELLCTTGWNTRFPLAAPYTLFPWLQATPDDLAAAAALGAPVLLLPPASMQGVEGAVSLGLRCRGTLVGWLIAHRVDAYTVRYSSLYVAPSHRARGQALALIAEGVGCQRLAGIPRAKAAIAPDSTAFLRLQQRHLHSFLQGMGQSRSSAIRLTAQG